MHKITDKDGHHYRPNYLGLPADSTVLDDISPPEFNADFHYINADVDGGKEVNGQWLYTLNHKKSYVSNKYGMWADSKSGTTMTYTFLVPYLNDMDSPVPMQGNLTFDLVGLKSVLDRLIRMKISKACADYKEASGPSGDDGLHWDALYNMSVAFIAGTASDFEKSVLSTEATDVDAFTLTVVDKYEKYSMVTASLRKEGKQTRTLITGDQNELIAKYISETTKLTDVIKQVTGE